MKTNTGMLVDVEVAEAGKFILLVIEGEAFPLSAEDAESIGRQLRDAAVELAGFEVRQ